MVKRNKITTTLAYLSGTVRVSITILKLLSEPEYITLMINTDTNQIAFIPSSKEDRAALKVKYRGSITRNGKFINSCNLVRKVFDIERWDKDYRYQVPGYFIEDSKIVYFDLNKAKKVSRQYSFKKEEVNEDGR